MYQGTHPKAKEARARRIEQHKRHTNERQRRNLIRMDNVANAKALTDEIALERLYGAMHEPDLERQVMLDDHAEWMAYASHCTCTIDPILCVAKRHAEWMGGQA